MTFTTHAKGLQPIAPTPFLDNGTIDYTSLDRSIDFHQNCGCSGLTVLAQLGEAPRRLARHDRRACIVDRNRNALVLIEKDSALIRAPAQTTGRITEKP